MDRAGDDALAMTSRSPSAPDSGSTAPASAGGGPRSPRRGRVWLAILISLAGLLLAALVALRQPAIATRAVNRLLAGAGGRDGTVLHLDRAQGDWVTGFELIGFRMVRHDTLLASADTIRARYRLISLLAGRLDVGEVTVAGAAWFAPPPDTARSRPAKPSLSLADLVRGRFYRGLPIRVERVNVRGARFGGRAGAPDSGLRIAPIDLRARDLRLGRGLSFQLDTLAAQLFPGADSAQRIVVALGASLADGRLEVRSLIARSVASRVDGAALAAVGARDSLAAIRVQVHTDPIALEDLAALAPGLDLAGRVALAVDVQGPRLDRLSGSAAARADRVRWRDLVFVSPRLDMAVSEGRAETRLETAFEQASLSLAGWIRPLDRVPFYDLEARADRLPARLPGISGWPELARRAGMAVTVAVRGSGYAQPVLDVSGRADGDAGHIGLDARLDMRHGVEWRVQQITCRDLDVARLAGDSVTSALDATLRAEGSGTDAASRRIAATLRIAPSRYGALEVQGGEIRAQVKGSDLGMALRIESSAGGIEIDTLTARAAASGAFRLAGRFHDVDLTRIAGQEALASRLTGTVRLDGRGLSSLSRPAARRSTGDAPSGPLQALKEGRLTARLHVTLEPSLLRGQTLSRGSVEGTMVDGAVDLALDLESSAGRIDVDAHARPFDAAPVYSLPHARFADLDLAAWTGSAALRSRLTGTLRGSAQAGVAPGRPMEWAGALALERSPIAGLTLAGADVRASGSGGASRLTAQLWTRGDTLTASGTAALDRAPHGHLECAVPLGVIAALAGRDSLVSTGGISARVDWSGRSPHTGRLEGTVTGRGTVDRARLDSLLARFRLERGTLTLDTLALASNTVTLAGTGRIPVFDSTATAPADLRLSLAVTDAAPLRRVLNADTLAIGVGTLQAHLFGTGAARGYEAKGGVRSLAWNEIRLLKADADLHGDLDRAWRPTRVEGQAALERLQAFDLAVDDLSVRGGYRDGAAEFVLHAGIDDAHSCRMTARSGFDSVGTHLTFDSLTVWADSATWALTRPGRVDLARDRVAFENLEIASAGGRVSAHGVIDRRGEQSFRLDMRGVGLDMLMAWLGRKDTRGVLAGSLSLAGPAAAPTGTGTLRVDVAVGDRPAGTLRSNLAWNGTRLDLGGGFATAEQDSLTWSGHLPLAISLAAADSVRDAHPVRVLEGDVDVRLAANRFPLRAFSPFLDPRSAGTPEGTLDIDARLSGSGRSLVGNGHVDLTGGALPLPGIGVSYRDLELHAAFAGDSLVVRRAHAASGKGTLDAAGRIRFVSATRIEPLLHVSAKRFTVVKTPDLKATTSADLDLSGTFMQPVVRGKVSVENTDVTFKQSDLAAGAAAATVPLSDADIRMMEESFGYVKTTAPAAGMAFYDASDLDLGVTLGGNVWLRQRVQPQMAVALTGQFRLRKAPHGEPVLNGRVEPVPQRGYVEQFARNFDITGGEVLLNGKTQDHQVNIQAQYKPPSTSESDESEVAVHLAVQGTADNLKLTLSSEPAMSDAEIVNFIATGRSRVDPSTSGAQGSSLAKDIGLAQVSGVAESAAQQAIGLDVLQVRFDALQGATLVSGSYLNPKLYVGIRQPLQYKDSNTPTSSETYRTRYEVEYTIHRWLVFNLQGETSKLRSFFRARHAY